ncbi:bifunctional aspartate transaminase/aspartate 4-decarboxylase [Desulforhopalus vacuolatus]|uniref:bifunctional aspartate transaminase/aspartate 4-decarboxylase n=1 Tax=Desulforhopalus vacuolatus TaxID=40414 RepID=UPI0034DF628E
MTDRKFEQSLEKLGAFEVSSKMLGLAKNNERHNSFLNAGRGNPNWINTRARLAFARFISFGVEESQRTTDEGDLAGYTTLDGIAGRFTAFLDEKNQTDAFLSQALEYCVQKLGMNEDVVVKEFTDAIIANNYPVPSRFLVKLEQIVNTYLQEKLYGGVDIAKQTTLFATEGGTAAIVYIFESLRRNHLIKEGDKIAINTPIFTPYLQIPHLTMYSMAEIDLCATEENDWHMKTEELDKLLDPSIKAFFLVNPSNPGARALGQPELDKIKEIASKRKDLIIITDDVYGTFVNGFQTVYAVAPYNTLLVYSYSKLYGATGWRVGTIAVNKKNVFDDLIAAMPEATQKEFDENYSIVTNEPRKLPFIERLTADSRSIGLYHTSGLSTPQQAMMALFSLTSLIAGKNDPYIESSKKIVADRYSTLMSTLGITEDNERTNSKYYCLIDIYKLARKRYDADFETWLRTKFEEIDFLLRLSEEEGVVLMEGVGFGASPGTLRVSQANLPDESYEILGERILQLLAEYHVEFSSKEEIKE